MPSVGRKAATPASACTLRIETINCLFRCFAKSQKKVFSRLERLWKCFKVKNRNVSQKDTEGCIGAEMMILANVDSQSFQRVFLNSGCQFKCVFQLPVLCARCTWIFSPIVKRHTILFLSLGVIFDQISSLAPWMSSCSCVSLTGLKHKQFLCAKKNTPQKKSPEKCQNIVSN